MKRFAVILSLLFMFIVQFPVQVFAAGGLVVDSESLLSSDERKDLRTMAQSISDTYGLDVILALEDTEDLLAFAVDALYDEYRTDAESGVVLLMDPIDEQLIVKAYGGATEVFNTIWVESFALDSEEAFSNQDYYGVMSDFILQADSSCRTAQEILDRTEKTPLLSEGDVEIDTDQKVYDYASLLTDSEEQTLAETARDILAEYGYDVVLVTTNDAEGKSSMEYADDFYDYNGFGVGDTYDGVLVLIDMENRMIWLSTCGKAISVFSDDEIQSLTDITASYLGDAEYYEGCSFALDEVEYVIRADIELATFGGRLRRSARRLPGYLFFAAVAGGITIAVMSYRGKTARKAKDAAGYLDRGSLRLAVREDRFLRSNTTRTRIESSSGGSGGGGSTTHRSSSGRSHGGGGSRF